MQLNERMKQLLQCHGIRNPEKIRPAYDLPVWKKTDPQQNPYWGVGDFYHMDKNIAPGQNLSWLEWDANEIHIGTGSEHDVAGILTKAFSIINGWKEQLETEYPRTPFIILMSFDDGRELIEDCGPYQSVTFRFWARRDVTEPADCSAPEAFGQPVLFEQVNF